MKKRGPLSLFTAIMMVSLLAFPALAQTTPGQANGEALSQPDPPVRLTDQLASWPACATWADVEAAFYRDGSTFPIDKITKFHNYGGYYGNSDVVNPEQPNLMYNYNLDEARFFPYYTVDEDSDKAKAMMDAFRKDPNARLTDYLFEDPEQFGIVFPPRHAPRMIEGSASCNGGEFYFWGKDDFTPETPMAEGGSPRQSLRLDREIIASLETAGMRPATTKAVYMSSRLAFGILFFDEERELYLSTEYGLGSHFSGIQELMPVRDLMETASGWFPPEPVETVPDGGKQPALTGKPVIYLYPEKETQVGVTLAFDGELTYTYPRYNGGWQVTAQPDGTLINRADGSEHAYLFWEGSGEHDWSFDQGFCVKGSDTEAFLCDALPKLGLLPKEYNDFIVYWVPKLQNNPYTLIKFADEAEYGKVARLTVSPKPDSIHRIHMVYQALDEPVEIEPQELRSFDRTGFTVVEWGGTEATTSRVHR